MRHKTTVVNPHLIMREDNIDIYTAVQEEGEFIVTFPYCYHSGFNLGFNCAESVNFATPRWIEYGQRSRPCNCSYDLAVHSRVRVCVLNGQAGRRSL